MTSRTRKTGEAPSDVGSDTSRTSVPLVQLWSFGWGDGGRLGHGDFGDVKYPTPVSALRNANFLQIAAGMAHSAAVIHENENVLYTWGFGFYGQLGHGETKNMAVPRRIDFFQGVLIGQVSCGDKITAALTTGGFVYTWGSLGPNTVVSTPMKVDIHNFNGEKVVAICCGTQHFIASTSDKSTFAWGSGALGQLGVVNESYVDKPRRVEGLTGVSIDILAAGSAHSLLYSTTDKCLYSFGNEQYGVLGLGEAADGSATAKRTHRISPPSIILSLAGKTLTKISSLWRHCAAVTDEGEVYTWGAGDSGQLGHEYRTNEWKPRIVNRFQEGGQQVSSAACGARHTVFCLKTGQVLTCGEGRYGRLGHGCDDDLLRATQINTFTQLQSNVTDVCAGHHHTMCITAPGRAEPGKISDMRIEGVELEPARKRRRISKSKTFVLQELKGFISRGRFTLDTIERWIDEVYRDTRKVDSVLDELLLAHLQQVEELLFERESWYSTSLNNARFQEVYDDDAATDGGRRSFMGSARPKSQLEDLNEEGDEEELVVKATARSRRTEHKRTDRSGVRELGEKLARSRGPSAGDY